MLIWIDPPGYGRTGGHFFAHGVRLSVTKNLDLLLFCSEGVMPHCIDPGTVQEFKWETFDGSNWEQEILQKKHIKERSKE